MVKVTHRVSTPFESPKMNAEEIPIAENSFEIKEMLFHHSNCDLKNHGLERIVEGDYHLTQIIMAKFHPPLKSKELDGIYFQIPSTQRLENSSTSQCNYDDCFVLSFYSTSSSILGNSTLELEKFVLDY